MSIESDNISSFLKEANGGLLFAVKKDGTCLIRGFGSLNELQAIRVATKLSLMASELRGLSPGTATANS